MNTFQVSSRPAIEDTLVQGTMQECGVVPRVWEQIQPVLIKNNEKQPMIRLCSYNVLCQETIEKTMHLYQHTRYDESCLYWEQRWRGLAKNLEQINADIFGLQEVQESHFWSHFSPFMRRRRYGAHYVRKDFPQVDGCAFFYRMDKFEGVHALTIRYFLADGTTLDKPQVAQLVRLRCKTTKKEVLVANTHIVFNPKRGDIKLAQIAILLAHIDKELKINGAAPVFILGDFNLHPKSDIYKFLLNSRLCCDSLTRNKLSGTSRDKRGPPVFASRIMPSESGISQNCMFIEGNELAPIEENVLTHPFKLQSVYELKSQQGVKGKGVSTYHAEVGNPDFIFYSVGRNGCSNSILFCIFVFSAAASVESYRDRFIRIFGKKDAHRIWELNNRGVERMRDGDWRNKKVYALAKEILEKVEVLMYDPEDRLEVTQTAVRESGLMHLNEYEINEILYLMRLH